MWYPFAVEFGVSNGAEFDVSGNIGADELGAGDDDRCKSPLSHGHTQLCACTHKHTYMRTLVRICTHADSCIYVVVYSEIHYPLVVKCGTRDSVIQ